MDLSRLHLELVHRGPSAATLAEVEALAANIEGFVLDARWFSNLALSARIDCTAGGLRRLGEALERQALSASSEQLAAVEQASRGLSDEEDVMLGVLVRCVHDEPEARRVVPSVPG